MYLIAGFKGCASGHGLSRAEYHGCLVRGVTGSQPHPAVRCPRREAHSSRMGRRAQRAGRKTGHTKALTNAGHVSALEDGGE